MLHSILGAIMVVLWIDPLVGCCVAAALMQPRSKADGERKTDDKSEPGKEGGAE